MKQKSLLQSILDELCGLIRRNEEDFADGVIQDLEDAIQRSAEPIKTAYDWLKQYQSYQY